MRFNVITRKLTADVAFRVSRVEESLTNKQKFAWMKYDVL